MNIQMGMLWHLQQRALSKDPESGSYPYEIEFKDRETGETTLFTGSVFAESEEHSRHLVERLSSVARFQLNKQKSRDSIEPIRSKKIGFITRSLGIKHVRRNAYIGYKGGDVEPFDYSKTIYGNLKGLLSHYVMRKKDDGKTGVYDKTRWLISYAISWSVLISVLVINVLTFFKGGFAGWTSLYVSLMLIVVSGMSVYALGKMEQQTQTDKGSDDE